MRMNSASSSNQAALIGAPSLPNRDAAPGAIGLERGRHALGAGTLDHALDERVVHAADHLPVVLSERVERAVREAHRAVVVERLVAARGEYLRDRRLRRGSSDLPPDLAGRVVRRAGAGPEEDLGDELVVAWRRTEHELALGPRVELRRPAGPGARTARRPSEADRQEPARREAVEVVGGERPAEPEGGRCLVARHRACGGGGEA